MKVSYMEFKFTRRDRALLIELLREVLNVFDSLCGFPASAILYAADQDDEAIQELGENHESAIELGYTPVLSINEGIVTLQAESGRTIQVESMNGGWLLSAWDHKRPSLVAFWPLIRFARNHNSYLIEVSFAGDLARQIVNEIYLQNENTTTEGVADLSGTDFGERFEGVPNLSDRELLGRFVPGAAS